jgi:carbonic anhydrase/acetyltransferase-like protein (isoleucine patch superfamily)
MAVEEDFDEIRAQQSFREQFECRQKTHQWYRAIWHRLASNDSLVAPVSESPSGDGGSACSMRACSPLEQQSLSISTSLPTGEPLRSLTPKIWLILPANQCQLDHGQLLQQYVTRTKFAGTVILVLPASLWQSGHETRELNVTDAAGAFGHLPRGLHDNGCVSNSIVHLEAVVHRNVVLSDCVIQSNAVLVNNGCLGVGPGEPSVWDGLTLSVGPESGGGRPLHLGLECTMMDVAQQLRTKPALTTTQDHFPLMNVFSHDCCVHDTPLLENVFLYPHAQIQGASRVQNVVLATNAVIRNSCTVRNVRMQWSCCIQDQSHISDCLMMEHSVAGPHSLVAQSVLGPDVQVSAGEVHASVLGPNTNAHHQSLLIGVVWLLGRGNVGYGANVGSNHTGRIPDQETWAGEGVFWGLSCVVKMPVNLVLAQYSIVAAGVTLPPQRIMMPFSLIVTSSTKPNANDILPGWVLQSSPYTISRSAKKYATRRKAKHHAYYTGWDILRPTIVEQCRWARHALQQPSATNPVGVGECLLSTKARNAGIRAYTDCLQRYALRGLLTFLQQHLENAVFPFSVWNDLPSMLISGTGLPALPFLLPGNDPVVAYEDIPPWKHQTDHGVDLQLLHCLAILREESPLAPTCASGSDAAALRLWLSERLAQLCELEESYKTRVYNCKHRDDVRGRVTIPGYAESHVSAASDGVIQEVNAEANSVKDQVQNVLTRIRQTESVSVMSPTSRL